MASSVTFSICSPARFAPSSSTAAVVAATSHTRVRRLPGRASCGTRVHTIPVFLATSTAATRCRTCSYSSSSISCGFIIARAAPPLIATGIPCGCPGASAGKPKY